MLAIGALTDPRPSIDRCVSLSCPWATRVRCEPPPASTSRTTYWQLQSAVPWWGQGELSGFLRAWRADGQLGGAVGGIRRTTAGCRLRRLERQFHRDPGAAARGRIQAELGPPQLGTFVHAQKAVMSS